MKEKYFYFVFQESHSSPENREHATYGVKVAPDGDRSACCDSISDVSLSEPALSELVRLCNELELSPIHLRDVVEDFLIQ